MMTRFHDTARWGLFALALTAPVLVPVLVPLPALAEMEGRFMLRPDADCSQRTTNGFLRIEDGIFYGAESECRMTNPIDVRGMEATLYDMVCTGEGSAWQERAMVMRGARDELILVWDGFAFAYPSCPVPPLRPRPRPVEFDDTALPNTPLPNAGLPVPADDGDATQRPRPRG